MVDIMRSKG